MEFKEFKNEWPPWFQINLIFLIPTNTIAGIVPARMIKDSQRDIFSFFFFFFLLQECFDSIFFC